MVSDHMYPCLVRRAQGPTALGKKADPILKCSVAGAKCFQGRIVLGLSTARFSFEICFTPAANSRFPDQEKTDNLLTGHL